MPVIKHGKNGGAATAPYVFQFFPVVAKNGSGESKICRDADEYERHTGVRVDEMGKPVDVKPERPMPPTLEMVIKDGYEERVAIGIVADEWRKCAAGEPPYDWNANPEPAADPDLSRSGESVSESTESTSPKSDSEPQSQPKKKKSASVMAEKGPSEEKDW